jgi:DNA polymerase I-like protein with 3'-5' exonuclease and polymerase domains
MDRLGCPGGEPEHDSPTPGYRTVEPVDILGCLVVRSISHRKLAKAVNFGLLYGMGAKGLGSYALRSYGIEMSSEEATIYRRRFFETYPGLKKWHEREQRAWQCSNVERLTDRLNTQSRVRERTA